MIEFEDIIEVGMSILFICYIILLIFLVFIVGYLIYNQVFI